MSDMGMSCILGVGQISMHADVNSAIQKVDNCRYYFFVFERVLELIVMFVCDGKMLQELNVLV